MGALSTVDEDFSEAVDLADKMPDKLKATAGAVRRGGAHIRRLSARRPLRRARASTPIGPRSRKGRTSFTYTAGVTRIPEGSAPPIYQRSHRITANIVVPDDKTEGVIVATGGAAPATRSM